MGLCSLAIMEWKNLRNTSLAMECKKLAIITRGKRTTMVASVFVFTLLACTAYLAFYSPGKIVTNPMGRSQTWFPSFFSGSNSSQSVSVFSFIFPHSDSASSATLDDQGGALKNSGDPHNLTARAPDGRNHMATEGSQQVNTGGNVAKSRGKGKKKRRGSAQNITLPVKGQRNPNLAPAPAIASTEEQTNPNLAPSPGIAYGGGRENATNGTYIGDVKVANNGESSSTNGKNRNASAAQQGAGSVPGRLKQCDIFSGRWFEDDSYPYYPAGSCPHLDESFDCFRNKRPDNEYEKWRWQPNECSIPRLNATDMLERLRGKRLAFVGDSLNRNMWESLVCILRHSVQDKDRVYEISGRHDFKTDGFYAFRYEDYNCSVEFVRTPFLVQEWEVPGGNGTVKETLRLDVIEGSAYKYMNADILVFNTGHWWTHEKTSQGLDYYQEGNRVYSKLNVVEAYRKALRTWAKWVDRNINPKKTQVFFRGYSASHFRGGQWNSGGQCHTESKPIFNESHLIMYPPKMSVLESVLKEMKTPVTYMNITRMTDYRKDGHPSVYRKQYMTQEERMTPERFQDCSHWCLPGVPDTWNELLYASLLMRGKGAWAT